MNVEDRRVFYHLLSGLTAVEEPTFQARRLCRALTARCVTIARMPLPEYSWLTVSTDSLLGIAMGGSCTRTQICGCRWIWLSASTDSQPARGLLIEILL